MSDSSLQLPLEQALRDFIVSQAVTGISVDNSFAAHEKKKVTTADFLGVIADRPDWKTMVVNAIVKVTFEIATGGLTDHEAAPEIAQAHSDKVSAIVDLFEKNFRTTKAALNDLEATWAAIGFTGFEPLDPEPDGTSEDGTQLISKLSFNFQVFLR